MADKPLDVLLLWWRWTGGSATEWCVPTSGEWCHDNLKVIRCVFTVLPTPDHWEWGEHFLHDVIWLPQNDLVEQVFFFFFLKSKWVCHSPIWRFASRQHDWDFSHPCVFKLHLTQKQKNTFWVSEAWSTIKFFTRVFLLRRNVTFTPLHLVMIFVAWIILVREILNTT